MRPCPALPLPVLFAVAARAGDAPPVSGESSVVVTAGLGPVSFTDLYYVSPTDQGNPDLNPEWNWSYEAGARWTGGPARAEVSFLQRDGRDVIDYVRPSPAVPWTALNLGEVRTRGLLLSSSFAPAAGDSSYRLRGSYTFLDSRSTLPALNESKYALAYLRHQVLLSADRTWGERLRLSGQARYESRVGFGAYWLLDARVSVPVGRVEFVLDGTNLLNTAWPGAAYTPMPGRWLTLGVRFAGP